MTAPGGQLGPGAAASAGRILAAATIRPAAGRLSQPDARPLLIERLRAAGRFAVCFVLIDPEHGTHPTPLLQNVARNVRASEIHRHAKPLQRPPGFARLGESGSCGDDSAGESEAAADAGRDHIIQDLVSLIEVPGRNKTVGQPKTQINVVPIVIRGRRPTAEHLSCLCSPARVVKDLRGSAQHLGPGNAFNTCPPFSGLQQRRQHPISAPGIPRADKAKRNIVGSQENHA